MIRTYNVLVFCSVVYVYYKWQQLVTPLLMIITARSGFCWNFI